MGFLLTRLIRGMTGIELDKLYEVAISTHTPHTRHDQFIFGVFEFSFISTHTPHTRHDHSPCRSPRRCIISTHTPHTRHDWWWVKTHTAWQISTHTPHTRHDGLWCVYDYGIIHFYSHASYEAWLHRQFCMPYINEFLLTRLIRGMTTIKQCWTSTPKFLLTRLIRGMTGGFWQNAD